MEKITIAILCKEKAHCLPLYLKCIYNQTYPKKLINIYIRSNNNTDNTLEILKKWIDEYKDEYNEIYYDFSNVESKIRLEDHSAHDWTSERFLILGNIRNESLKYAFQKESNYFVCDCDNFIVPSTLSDLYYTKLPIVGPLMHRYNHPYSNYHDTADENGYMVVGTEQYSILKERKVKGLVSVDVIHCAYFIRYDILPQMNYIDNTGRHEYVIFSDISRKNNILQFLDTRKNYGIISFSDTKDELENEEWYYKDISLLNDIYKEEKILIISPQAGFGNRLRAFASGIAISLRENRKPYYLWKDTKHGHLQNLMDFTEFFEEKISKARKDIIIDEVLTEWMPGEYWYQFQSEGQREYNYKNIKKIRDIFVTDKTNVLLETSLTLDITDDQMMHVYKTYFKPRKYYMDMLFQIQNNIDIGISIRRGNLLQYFPEANQSIEDIISWINSSFLGKTIIIFSDDKNFRNEVKKSLKNVTCLMNVEEIFPTLRGYEVAFLEFLILSYNCEKIYGTPKSSFAEHASLFGGKKHYSTVLS